MSHDFHKSSKQSSRRRGRKPLEHACGRRREKRGVRLGIELLESRLLLSKLAYLVAGLGGQDAENWSDNSKNTFPADLVNSLLNEGFEVDLANWNSSNYKAIGGSNPGYNSLKWGLFELVLETVSTTTPAVMPLG
jgi:hypothetical protein